jgi:hypothetical protein
MEEIERKLCRFLNMALIQRLTEFVREHFAGGVSSVRQRFSREAR